MDEYLLNLFFHDELLKDILKLLSCISETNIYNQSIRSTFFMNAVEIEEAVSSLALEEFDDIEFPYKFLSAFGNNKTTIKKLRSGTTNKSSMGGVLQRNNIHIQTCEQGNVDTSLNLLKESSETKRAKARFILSTDGKYMSSEDLFTGETISCEYKNFAEYFGFFLPLSGISPEPQIKENSIDIKATGRLNKLYLELLKNNPDLDSPERKEEMNHFMARLIFCFFAEDICIFGNNISFTKTIEQISDRNSSNTSQIISKIFDAMNMPTEKKKENNFPKWAIKFPYVNGGLFSKKISIPNFSKIARSYLFHLGNLDWQKINPDIFGSMIQVVVEVEERGNLGMHYTSVPNILKLLNPLFLNNIRESLENSKGNKRKLLILRNRISKIRVFDPACGSGNFLVIAYKELRKLEDDINRELGELGKKSIIPLTNFRGIEIRNFSCEIARLALIIAEYQCNVIYLGQKEALLEFLPLENKNWITFGNALEMNWENICPAKGEQIQHEKDIVFPQDNFMPTINFKNAGGEVYICGNPPFLGSQRQSKEQKSDLKLVFENYLKLWKKLDYVSAWFMKAALYCNGQSNTSAAFVATNSICQGWHVSILWEAILKEKQEIIFAYRSFKWSNLASHNAGVTVVIVGIANSSNKKKLLFYKENENELVQKECKNISPYLTNGPNIIVHPRMKPLNNLGEMSLGSMPNDNGFLILSASESNEAIKKYEVNEKFIKPFLGAQEFIKGEEKRCIWLDEKDYEEAKQNNWLKERFLEVEKYRLSSRRQATKKLAKFPYRFGEVRQSGNEKCIIMPSVSSENREYLPVGIANSGTIISNRNYAIFNSELWNMAILASKLHYVWIRSVCSRLEMRISYSNQIGWNAFPIPNLTTQNKSDLTSSAKEILLARESHFPKTISDIYDSKNIPENVILAHQINDEILERIYIGRCFKNDTERLEQLFQLYVQALN